MKLTLQNEVDNLTSWKQPLTASGIGQEQKQMEKQMSDAGKKRDQPDGDTLYICGADCTGKRATAADPLAHYGCPFYEAHCRAKGVSTRPCYKPRVVDTRGDCDHATEEWQEKEEAIDR
jgi:hypothetical protein